MEKEPYHSTKEMECPHCGGVNFEAVEDDLCFDGQMLDTACDWCNKPVRIVMALQASGYAIKALPEAK